MRTLVITKASSSQSILSRVVAGKATAAQTESALQQLQALNPHLDINNMKAGTVILIPDAPNFNATEGDPVGSGTFDDFQQLVRSGLSDASQRLRAGDAARAADRSDINALLKSAAFKKVLDADAALKQQLTDATKTYKDEQTQEDQDEAAVAAAAKLIIAELADLAKTLG
ncbi:MAG TPA: hypothetical protein VGM72_13695 [Micropepsaceae bacterium]|jgi:hypothetical protein